MQVVEQADERLFVGVLLEELSERPRNLACVRRYVALAGQRAAWPRSVAVRQVLELLEDLDDGPVRDAVAVREATATHDLGFEAGEELGREPRLADAGGAEDGEELARAVVSRLLE